MEYFPSIIYWFIVFKKNRNKISTGIKPKTSNKGTFDTNLKDLKAENRPDNTAIRQKEHLTKYKSKNSNREDTSTTNTSNGRFESVALPKFRR